MVRPVGSRGFQNLAGRVGSGHYALKSHGPSRVKRFQNLAGRVGSRGFQNLAGRVGSSPAKYGSFAGPAIMTRELFSADPRVKPTDLARGSAFFKLTAEGH